MEEGEGVGRSQRGKGLAVWSRGSHLLLILRYTAHCYSGISLDEAILLHGILKWPHQEPSQWRGLWGAGEGWGQTCTGGRGWTGSRPDAYHYYLVSVAGEAMGQIEIGERRGLKPQTSTQHHSCFLHHLP